MHKRRETESIENVRMVSDQRGAAYCGMGLQTFRRWSEEIGARRKFGPKIVRNDLFVINEVLNAKASEDRPTVKGAF